MGDPYDELPYISVPVEWTAPERMAVTSLLHGGPRPPVESYRYLELGCGDATNLVPLARYRPAARFTGVDGSAALMATARAERDAVGLANLDLAQGSFADVLGGLEGPFDYIVLHGVLSWVDDATRDALLAFAGRALHPAGLFYVSYNARPGWNVRGLVREFLLAQTATGPDLRARTAQAKSAAAELSQLLRASEHAYSRLMADEFGIVRDATESYVAHEYLAGVNRAYWQSELRALLAAHGLAFVADADFAYPSAQIAPGLAPWLAERGFTGRAHEDTLDLLCYAQFRCALACRRDAPRAAWSRAAANELVVAPSLTVERGGERPVLKTPRGLEVTSSNPTMEARLVELAKGAPAAQPVSRLFGDLADAADDLALLHRAGAVELRAWESAVPACPILRARELGRRREFTSPHHLRVAQTDRPPPEGRPDSI
jgi:SAM-dependent methyltransferase